MSHLSTLAVVCLSLLHKLSALYYW